jgi:RNA polymerase sigma factor (sigma-70 family)
MSHFTLAAEIRHLRDKLVQQCLHDQSDEQLLNAFASRRDENAFAALVRRHGTMVLHVCRRVLSHEQDAEDAFQATFLVFARNASSLRIRTTLAGFLHGTAYRTAMKAKQSAARRRKHEGQATTRPNTDPADELSWREVRALLDEEIAQLPEIYRSVFVLCCLENLSQAEASRRLELKERTVSNRLAAARKRLAQRLARRGVELTAVLTTLALATEPASALPIELMATTIKAALATAAGESLARVVSASVAALVKNSSSILSLGKAKLAIALVAATLLGGGVLLHFQAAANESDSPPAAEKAKPQPLAQPAGKEAKESATYAGRVVDPDGKPVKDAKLYLLYYTPKELPIPVRGTTDEDGRFRFSVARKDFDPSASARPWDEAIVVATAKGFGVGLPVFPTGEDMMPTGPVQQDKLTVQLAKDDVPIIGRVLDLQGKPLAGVTVRVHGLWWPNKGDLTTWVGDLKEKQEAYPSLHAHMIGLENWIGRDFGKIFPQVVTAADGRFRLSGIGRERLAVLRLEGPSIVATERFVMTRPGDTIRAAMWRRNAADPEMIFCGSDFEHLAAPCQPIVGVVRDKDTGKPLPGAVVRSYVFAGSHYVGQMYVSAIADKDGRYRLAGMPKGKGNVIRATGPDGEPYQMSRADVPEGFALEPVTVDFQLKRGVWIEGAVTDKATGKPVHSIIHCAIFPQNPFRKEAPGLTFEDSNWTYAKDASFRFAGLPGRSVVTALTTEPGYLNNVGADRIKDLARYRLFQPFHAIAEINPEKDAQVVRCNLVVESGGTLKGTLLGPDGQRLLGVKAAGLRSAGVWEQLETAEFTALALQPGETRLLQFAHVEKHLAASVVVRADTKGPLTVKLKPAATLTGRFVTPDGKPLPDLVIYAGLYGLIADPSMLKPLAPDIGTFPDRFHSDKDGKFRIENLAPDLKYRLRLQKGMYALIPDGPAGSGVTVKEGETRDLGDVIVKPIE